MAPRVIRTSFWVLQSATVSLVTLVSTVNTVHDGDDMQPLTGESRDIHVKRKSIIHLSESQSCLYATVRGGGKAGGGFIPKHSLKSEIQQSRMIDIRSYYVQILFYHRQ